MGLGFSGWDWGVLGFPEVDQGVLGRDWSVLGGIGVGLGWDWGGMHPCMGLRCPGLGSVPGVSQVGPLPVPSPVSPTLVAGGRM